MALSSATGVQQQADGASAGDFTFAPDVSFTRLDNGLEVLVLPDARSEAVTHMVWYKNGSVDDPMGKSGIAHFLEHLMFKGTPTYSAEEFRKTVSRSGGMFNAFTSPAVTSYFEQTTRDILPKCMAFEADRMQNLVFDAAVSAAERDVILAERGTVVEADPDRLLDEAMMAATFGAAPEGRPVIGWRSEIEALTHEDAQAYYQRFYTPSNAVLVIVGGIEIAEARDLAAKYYGSIPNREIVARVPSQFAPLPSEPVVLEHPSVRVQDARRSYRVPSAKTDPKLAMALDVLAFYLAGSDAGLLKHALTVERGVASDVRAGYLADIFPYETIFMVSASASETVEIERLEAELDAVLGKLASEGMREDVLARCKRHYEARSMFAIDNQLTLAQYLGMKLALNNPIGPAIGWQRELHSLTLADTMRAAALLAPRRALRGRLLQGSSLKPTAAA